MNEEEHATTSTAAEPLVNALTRCVPLDGYFNASTTDVRVWPSGVAPLVASLPHGQQTFWGLPFALGDATSGADNVVLARGEDAASVELPVDGTATYVVFAHFLGDDETSDPLWRAGHVTANDDPGARVGRYSLVYADDSVSNVVVRVRFEIASPMPRQSPFLAQWHTEPVPVDFRGPAPRGLWGRMQPGVVVGGLPPEGSVGPAGVWTLYAMESPTPDAVIRAIRIEADRGRTVAVGGITLYTGTNHPFRRERLTAVQLTPTAGDTSTSLDLDVDVGTIARIGVAEPVDVASWLRGQAPGRGELRPPADAAAGVWAQLAANRDATLHIGGSAISMAQLYNQGAGVSTDRRWHARVVDRDRMWLQGRVIDSATGQPTPARVHFRSLEGRYLPPYGHRVEVNDGWFEDYGADLKLGSTEYAYVDGRFRIELPPGPVLVEVAKGFEYIPIRRQVDIEAGQTELTLRLDRLADWRRDGWATGDTHVHFLSPDTARLEAKAEGVNVVNLLAAQWGDLYTNVGDITGELAGCSDADTLVWVGTENRQHFLGHISLLGVHGEPVAPFSTGGPAAGYIGDGTAAALAHWSDEARLKQALVIAPHFPFPYSEVIADVILGKVDAVEQVAYLNETLDDFRVHEWYRLLNCGYRVPVVGGTDKMSAATPVGGTRTYAYIGDRPLDFDSWAHAIRSGRTFATSGPLLHLTVDGHAPGEQIGLPASGGTVSVRVAAMSAVPLRSLEIVCNGRVVADTTAATRDGLSMTIDQDLRVDSSGWISARCSTGQRAWMHGKTTLIAAHTSPVYVMCGDSRLVPDAATGRYFLTTLQGGVEWLDTLAPIESPTTHARIRQIFVDAMNDLRSKMEAPA